MYSLGMVTVSPLLGAHPLTNWSPPMADDFNRILEEYKAARMDLQVKLFPVIRDWISAQARGGASSVLVLAAVGATLSTILARTFVLTCPDHAPKQKDIQEILKVFNESFTQQVAESIAEGIKAKQAKTKDAQP